MEQGRIFGCRNKSAKNPTADIMYPQQANCRHDALTVDAKMQKKITALNAENIIKSNSL
jgi:hypothetical protein